MNDILFFLLPLNSLSGVIPLYCNTLTYTEPIKSMRFKFDQSIEFSLTEENTEALHPLQVLPGRYAPTCQVNGSKPTANVRIMMDSDLMNGRKFDLDDKMVTEFVAEETDFRSQYHHVSL